VRVVLLFISMSFLFLVSCGPNNENVKKDTTVVPDINKTDSLDTPTLMSLAEDELKNKNYTKAAEFSDTVIKREPANVQAKVLKGRILTDSKAYLEAENYFTALSKELPASTLVAYHFGRLYEILGRDASALKYYRKCYDLGDKSSAMITKLIDHYMKANKYTDAISFFQNHLTTVGENPYMRYNLGLSYFYLGQNTNAGAQFELLTIKNPQYSLGFYGLGMVYHTIAMKTKTKTDKNKALTNLQKFIAMEKTKTFYINKANKMISELQK